MTDVAPLRPDEPIEDAGIDGIGSRTAERLYAAGVSSVGQLANADVGRLSETLTDSYPRLKPETLRRRVEQWVARARESISGADGHNPRGHVFLLTLWADANGQPIRSRFGYRNPDEPTTEERSVEAVGWSPLAFAGFVERNARLALARELSEAGGGSADVVEWSRHDVEGPLVRGDAAAVKIRADLKTDQLGDLGGSIRWRANGRLVPFGTGPQLSVGSCSGCVGEGDTIALDFGSHHVPDRLHRVWITLAVHPPVSVERLSLSASA